jgi:hypothetical protein
MQSLSQRVRLDPVLPLVLEISRASTTELAFVSQSCRIAPYHITSRIIFGAGNVAPVASGTCQLLVQSFGGQELWKTGWLSSHLCSGAKMVVRGKRLIWQTVQQTQHQFPSWAAVNRLNECADGASRSAMLFYHFSSPLPSRLQTNSLALL